MSEQHPQGRRAFLAGAATVGLGGLAGCLSGGGAEATETVPPTPTPDPGDESYGDGYPPAAESTPAEQEVDRSRFNQLDVEGTTVPAIPLDVAHYWHQRGAARFADARSEKEFTKSHVLGAVLSPAPDGGGEADPVADWPKDARVVCYCGCPHHLSSLRAASLIEDGYENVSVIDDGFWEWHDAGYPMAGTDVTTQPKLRTIRGVVDAAHAGATAWAWHDPSGQREATEIAADGAYELHLRFADVSPDSQIRVETPAYVVEGTLAELASKTVTGQ